MDLVAVVYLSHSYAFLDEWQLETLLTDARTFNDRNQITGVLLYSDGSFFQYFEGEHKSVELVYQRIKRSRLHFGMLELLNGPIKQREFANWNMGFRHSPRSEIKQLAQARWVETLDAVKQKPIDSFGVKLLVDYWERAQSLVV